MESFRYKQKFPLTKIQVLTWLSNHLKTLQNETFNEDRSMIEVLRQKIDATLSPIIVHQEDLLPELLSNLPEKLEAMIVQAITLLRILWKKNLPASSSSNDPIKILNESQDKHHALRLIGLILNQIKKYSLENDGIPFPKTDEISIPNNDHYQKIELDLQGDELDSTFEFMHSDDKTDEEKKVHPDEQQKNVNRLKWLTLCYTRLAECNLNLLSEENRSNLNKMLDALRTLRSDPECIEKIPTSSDIHIAPIEFLYTLWEETLALHNGISAKPEDDEVEFLGLIGLMLHDIKENNLCPEINFPIQIQTSDLVPCASEYKKINFDAMLQEKRVYYLIIKLIKMYEDSKHTKHTEDIDILNELRIILEDTNPSPFMLDSLLKNPRSDLLKISYAVAGISNQDHESSLLLYSSLRYPSRLHAQQQMLLSIFGPATCDNIEKLNNTPNESLFRRCIGIILQNELNAFSIPVFLVDHNHFYKERNIIDLCDPLRNMQINYGQHSALLEFRINNPQQLAGGNLVAYYLATKTLPVFINHSTISLHDLPLSLDETISNLDPTDKMFEEGSSYQNYYNLLNEYILEQKQSKNKLAIEELLFIYAIDGKLLQIQRLDHKSRDENKTVEEKMTIRMNIYEIILKLIRFIDHHSSIYENINSLTFYINKFKKHILSGYINICNEDLSLSTMTPFKLPAEEKCKCLIINNKTRLKGADFSGYKKLPLVLEVVEDNNHTLSVLPKDKFFAKLNPLPLLRLIDNDLSQDYSKLVNPEIKLTHFSPPPIFLEHEFIAAIEIGRRLFHIYNAGSTSNKISKVESLLKYIDENSKTTDQHSSMWRMRAITFKNAMSGLKKAMENQLKLQQATF